MVSAAIAQGITSCAISRDGPSQAQSLPPVNFASEIEPILATHCYECHGSARAPKGRLRLNQRAGALAGGRSGQPAIVPGNSAASPLVLAIRKDDPYLWRQMPPDELLSDAEIELIERWIDEGASWPR